MLRKTLYPIIFFLFTSSSFAATITSEKFKGTTGLFDNISSNTIHTHTLEADTITGAGINFEIPALLETVDGHFTGDLTVDGDLNANVSVENVKYVRTGDSLETMLQDGNNTGKNLIVVSNQVIANSIDSLAGINVEVKKGGMITVNNGITLRLMGPFQAGVYKVFNLIGTGKVYFGKTTGSTSGDFTSTSSTTRTVYPEWFGATADYQISSSTGTDSYAAIMAAIDSISIPPVYTSIGVVAAGEVKFAKGAYYSSNTIKLKSSVILSGAGMYYGTTIVFPVNKDGIAVDYYNTDGRNGDYSTPPYKSGAYSQIKDMFLRGTKTGSTIGCGIYLKARAAIDHVYVYGFKEDGFRVWADTGSGENYGNANNFQISYSVADHNDGNGYYVNGSDANAGIVLACSAMYNGGWGFWDSSFLGNTYIAGHAENNTGGSYKSDDANARNVYVGCYSEAGTPPMELSAAANVFGGLLGSGLSSEGWGFAIRGNIAQGELSFYPPEGTGHSTINPRFVIGPHGQENVIYKMQNDSDNSSGIYTVWSDITGMYTTRNSTKVMMGQTGVVEGSNATYTTGGRSGFQTGSLFFPNGFFLGGDNSVVGGRFVDSGTAAPASGEHAKGDFRHNESPTEAGTAGSKYVILGWTCVTSGTPGTWLAVRGLTGN